MSLSDVPLKKAQDTIGTPTEIGAPYHRGPSKESRPQKGVYGNGALVTVLEIGQLNVS